MSPLAAVLAPLLPGLLPLPSEFSPLPPLDPEQEKRRLFAALAHLFLRQAADQPALLIVEDLHWSDEASLEFFHYLARRCSASSMLVLLTYLSDEVQPNLSHFLAHLDREHLAQESVLAPLTRSDTSAMLHAIFDLRRSVFMAPRFVQGELLDAMCSLTEGNPFFIEEVLKALIEAGDIYYEQGRWMHKPLGGLHIPRSVHDAVHRRTGQLSEGTRQLLNLAAVAGRHFDFALLQELTHQDEAQLLPLIKELIAAQLFVEESAERFGFRHALTRQAIYAALLLRERKALHRTILETLERLYASTLEAHLADLAFHAFEAGAWEQALVYGQRAGDQAQALWAPRAAVEHFTRALEAAHQGALTPSAQLYRARGQAYETKGHFEQARADHEAALLLAHLAGDRHGEWQSQVDLGFLWAGRDYVKAGDYYRQALALARAMDDQATLAHTLNRLGNWRLNVEQPHDALRLHQEALAMFQALADRRGEASTLDLLGMASLLSGDLRQGAVYNRQAIVLFRELDDRQRLISSLVTPMLCGGNYQNDTLVPAASWR
jgi:predicted ATPase